MSRLDPLIEELLVATATMTVLSVVVAVLYRLVTGWSPWPYVIIAEIGGFGWGVVLLTLTAPRRGR